MSARACPQRCVVLFISLFICISLISADRMANYSVQLMAGLAPAGWSASEWTAAADTMIGKTQAYILWDLIEDLGIELKVTEASIREEIDTRRTEIGLSSLPPYEKKPGPFDFLREYKNQDEDYASYLPAGWTEAKIKAHTAEDKAALTEEDAEKLAKRLKHDVISNPNQGYLEELPEAVLAKITGNLHEEARLAAHLPQGVRAFKRNVSPLVQVVEIQSYEAFGFVLYRTGISNDTVWRTFLERLEEINNIHLEDNGYHGTLLGLITDRFRLHIVDDEKLKIHTAQDCREHFKKMRKAGGLDLGHDVGVFLLADEKVMNYLVEPTFDNAAHLWAVDVDFDESNRDGELYGYEGMFEVHPAALLHDLFVAVGSGMMTPAEIWGLVGKPKYAEEGRGRIGGHDEL